MSFAEFSGGKSKTDYGTHNEASLVNGEGSYQSGSTPHPNNNNNNNGGERMVKDLKNLVRKVNDRVGSIEKKARRLGNARDGGDALASEINSSITKTVNELKQAKSILAKIEKNGVQGRSKAEVSRLKKDLVEVSRHFNETSNLVQQKHKEAKRNERNKIDSVKSEYDENIDNVDNDDDRMALMQAHRQENDEALMSELSVHENLIAERQENIEFVQSEILAVNDMFRDLSDQVETQGKDIDLLEVKVAQSASNVERGESEVKQANKYQKSSRTKLCVLLILVLLVAAIVTAILVVIGKIVL